MMSAPTPQTHQANTTHIDTTKRVAHCTVQWFCERDQTKHPITFHNQLDIFMCGQQAFSEIARDIACAQSTVDLICWGFDPAMELIRKENSAWPRGQTYGDLLSAIAARGVKVRLLVWHAYLPGYIQNNLVGLTGDQRSGYLLSTPNTSAEDAALGAAMQSSMTGLPPSANTAMRKTPVSPEQARQDYCVQWWRNAQAGRIPNLEVRSRKNNADAILKNLRDPASPEDMPSAAAPSHAGLINEYDLIVKNGTHHQKTLLIDYAHLGGKAATGYVMGLNSTSDYWDTSEHLFDTSLRETDWALKSATARQLGQRRPVSRDPLHDYVSRIQGAALQDVHRNFFSAWLRAGGKAHPEENTALPSLLPRVKNGSVIQIVRTQPEESDKTIKNAYFQSAGLARNYLYIENQYFFYECWVRHLKEKRSKFIQWAQDAGKKHQECTLLHMICVIPQPEDDGMVPRTYDMVRSLGEGKSMGSNEQGGQGGQQALLAAMRKQYDRDLA
jgi:phosphatidylserine/phosphatidylglycerophosphate/cardiolipin synthase-like enzyme